MVLSWIPLLGHPIQDFQYRISNAGSPLQCSVPNAGFPIPYPIPSMMDGWPAGYDGWMATIHDGWMEEKRKRRPLGALE